MYLYVYFSKNISIINNMRLLFKLILIFIFIYNVNSFLYAQEEKTPQAWGENSSVFNDAFEGQKPVTDNKLKKTIDMLKERSLTKKQKKIREEVKPLSPSSDFEHLKTFTQTQTAEDGLGLSHTVLIPMKAYSEDGAYITPGYYKLSCRKIAKNEYVLDLSQGNKKMLSVKAFHTKQDLEQDSISFCDAEIIDDNRIRLIFGSIDLNLVGYLYF